MVEDIFEMIMKAARAIPNKDLVKNLYSILLELHIKAFTVMGDIREEERRKKEHEKQRPNP